MEATERRTCEDRLPEHLAGRIDDLAEFNERLDSDDWEEAELAVQDIDAYGLGLSVHKVLRWDLSTGGPGDWLEFHVDDYGDLCRIDYVFQDWWDGARSEVLGEGFRIASEFFERNLRDYVESVP